MAKSIGIDLGTTNSVVGIKKVNTEIIKNAEGDFITPSCVTMKKVGRKFLNIGKSANFIVGKSAIEWIKQDPENTITGVKRLMGRSFQDPEIQKMISDRYRQYKIIGHSKGTQNSLAIMLRDREYTPEQISSKILEKLKRDAEDALNDQVEYAVITVPAYFNDKQKHATRTAAALAGLKVRRLLPEPTAAAISFGVDTVKGDDAKTVLIFDFGGGTFDLSVLTISGGQFIEMGKGGNMWLGGEDIDHRIADFVLSETAREYGLENLSALIDHQDLILKNRFLGELKTAVEQAKIRLSNEQVAYIEILGILKDEDDDHLDVNVELSREQFSRIIAPVVDATINLTCKMLEDIHFTPDLIDNILLVGGSSRIPAVVEALQKEFGKEKVLLHDRPMLAITEGAAILSHRLSDTYECPKCGKSVAQSDHRCADCDFDLEANIVAEGVFDIVHSAAHDYYIHLENDTKHLLIEKNTPLPCEKTEVFKLVHPDQKLIHMKFSNIVNESEESIGDLWLGINKSHINTKNTPSVELTLEIDENNLVAVAAALKEHPDVEISKTLSRGKADEKLFMALEKLISTANQKAYSEYMTFDLTSRALSIVKDIHKIIDQKTGELIEPVYNLAKMKIDKAEKMAEKNIACKPLIYYAEDALDSFGPIISPGDQAGIRRKIKKLNEMDEHGTFEENLKAHKQLDTAMDNLHGINALMTIQKAGEACEEHEPVKAAKFFNTLETILSIDPKNDNGRTAALINEIFPLADKILDKYDSNTGIIHKDITR
ncbi:MAG: Hsp70 family protein [Deltaproteobacteria bacterium]|nr:Hsp70 family protein [Deltaproteobacteria bacterium]